MPVSEIKEVFAFKMFRGTNSLTDLSVTQQQELYFKEITW